MYDHPKAPEHPAPFTLVRIVEGFESRLHGALPKRLMEKVRTFPTLARATWPYRRGLTLGSFFDPPELHSISRQRTARYGGPSQLRQDLSGPGFVLIDAAGKVVPPRLVIGERERIAFEYRLKREAETERSFRKMPAQGVWSRRGRKCFRYPRTFQEIRAMQHDDVDGFVVKARVARRNLVDAYDDPSHAHQPHRNWKSYRKTQWKK